MINGQSLEEAIRSEARRLGFAACGFARADARRRRRARAQALARGRPSRDDGLDGGARAPRVSPLALWPEARSAIALGMSYAPAADPLALAGQPELGRISVYAQGGDYHKTVKKALKALARFIVEQAPSELKVFVDTAPVMEKPLAQAAGHRLAGQAHQPRQPRAWQLAVPRRDPDQPRARARRAGRRRPALRHLHALPRRLPDAGVRRPAPDRCAALHLLPDDRA